MAEKKRMKWNWESVAAFVVCVVASVVCFIAKAPDPGWVFAGFAGGIASLPQLRTRIGGDSDAS